MTAGMILDGFKDALQLADLCDKPELLHHKVTCHV